MRTLIVLLLLVGSAWATPPDPTDAQLDKLENYCPEEAKDNTKVKNCIAVNHEARIDELEEGGGGGAASTAQTLTVLDAEGDVIGPAMYQSYRRVYVWIADSGWVYVDGGNAAELPYHLVTPALTNEIHVVVDDCDDPTMVGANMSADYARDLIPKTIINVEGSLYKTEPLGYGITGSYPLVEQSGACGSFNIANYEIVWTVTKVVDDWAVEWPAPWQLVYR